MPRVMQTVTYGNIESCGVNDDGRCHGDGAVYADIQQSASTPASAAAGPQYDDREASERVVYSRLVSN